MFYFLKADYGPAEKVHFNPERMERKKNKQVAKSRSRVKKEIGVEWGFEVKGGLRRSQKKGLSDKSGQETEI